MVSFLDKHIWIPHVENKVLENIGFKWGPISIAFYGIYLFLKICNHWINKKSEKLTKKCNLFWISLLEMLKLPICSTFVILLCMLSHLSVKRHSVIFLPPPPPQKKKKSIFFLERGGGVFYKWCLNLLQKKD